MSATLDDVGGRRKPTLLGGCDPAFTNGVLHVTDTPVTG